MMRMLLILAAAAVIGSAGCVDGPMAKGGLFNNKEIKVPEATEASTAVAARVDQVGRQLVSQNPFLGVEPTFHTLGRKELEIHHIDAHGVFITEGLVAKCATDDELAAVLASELGKMSAEKRTTDRMGLPDPLRALPDPNGMSPGGVSSDQNQLGTQAFFDKKMAPPGKLKGTTEDPAKIANEALTAAGYDAKAIPKVAPLLAEASRGHAIADYFAFRRERPRWSN